MIGNTAGIAERYSRQPRGSPIQPNIWVPLSDNWITAPAKRHTRTTTSPLRQALLAWYRAHKRDLDWRRTRDPYAIWISEIMLQQTRVAAIIPYYRRFLARFPSVRRLAMARLGLGVALLGRPWLLQPPHATRTAPQSKSSDGTAANFHEATPTRWPCPASEAIRRLPS